MRTTRGDWTRIRLRNTCRSLSRGWATTIWKNSGNSSRTPPWICMLAMRALPELWPCTSFTQNPVPRQSHIQKKVTFLRDGHIQQSDSSEQVIFLRGTMNRHVRIDDDLYYHVYNRGNDRRRIFGDASDYKTFVEKMKVLAKRYLVEVAAYTLMPNHYHLVVRQHADGSVSRMMGALATSTAKRHNLKYKRVGHLFQGPFRYKPVSEGTLWYVTCYVHLNPVHAGLVTMPEDWRYSNFAEVAEGFLHPRTSQDEANLQLWNGYVQYVRDVIKNEQMQRELRKILTSHAEGFLPSEGFLHPRTSQDEANLSMPAAPPVAANRKDR